METKHIKQILVLVLCVTFVFTSVNAGIPYLYADTDQPTTVESTDAVPTADQEPTVSTEEIQPEETEKQKKTEAKTAKQLEAEKKSKKKAATKKRQQMIVKFAKKQVGKGYKYGAKGPKTFDCIGLVYYVFKNAGAKLKSSITYEKICHMKKSYGKYMVSGGKSKAKAGDIVFFYSGNKVKHACVAIGNGKCVNATKKGVKIQKIRDHSGCKTGVIRLVK